jgi:hypothetical protein
MRKKDFDNLVTSIRQAGRIRQTKWSPRFQEDCDRLRQQTANSHPPSQMSSSPIHGAFRPASRPAVDGGFTKTEKSARPVHGSYHRLA